jgi:hypothetical protein
MYPLDSNAPYIPEVFIRTKPSDMPIAAESRA